MRILVLEDQAPRIKSLKKHLSNHEVVFVDTVQGFQSTVLENPKFELMLLDRDIGNKKFTGEHVSDWLASKTYDHKKIPDMVIIHTRNVVAAPRMEHALTKAGIGCRIWPYDNELLDALSKLA